MTELLTALAKINLAATAAILVVLVLRIPARRVFGAEAAYRLWICPPLAAFAVLLPARTVGGPGLEANLASGAIAISPTILTLTWIAGIVAFCALIVRGQLAFLREARAGRAGPAVVGVLAPRIVMPSDGRYSDEERALVREHEREHIARGDSRAVAIAALLQGLFWFNPLVHLAGHLLRLDQELACDAGVMRRMGRARVQYARTLLKTQLAAAPLPIGCYWPTRSRHPLELRIGLLGGAAPSTTRRMAGAVLTGLCALSVAAAAWAAQPLQPRDEPFKWPARPNVILVDLTP